MDRVESLKSRISTLESENRWLKHRVSLLCGALRKQHTRRKQNKVSDLTTICFETNVVNMRSWLLMAIAVLAMLIICMFYAQLYLC